MKPTLMLAVILSLVATTKAHAEEDTERPAGGWSAEAGSPPTSQLASGRTAAPDARPIRQPTWAADTRTGAASTLVTLWAQIKSSDTEIRAAAAIALSGVAEKAAVDLLVKTLTSDPSADVRQAAAQALGQREARSALAPLCRAARDETSPAVKDAAERAIRQIRRSHIEADDLLACPGDRSYKRAIKRAMREEPGYRAAGAKKGIGIALLTVGSLAALVMGTIAVTGGGDGDENNKHYKDEAEFSRGWGRVSDEAALNLGIGAIGSLGLALGVGLPLVISGTKDRREIHRRAKERLAAGSVELANGPGQAGLGLRYHF